MTINSELEADILRLHHVEHWGPHTIARQLNVHHSVVDRVLSQAGLPKIERSARASMIDPYLPFIVATLEQYPRLTAARLFHMVRERGYRGSESHFRARIAGLRPRAQPEAYLRLKTLPGEQAQVDWGHFGHVQVGQARRPLMAFVIVLSWSRKVFLRFYLNALGDTFAAGHVEAFSRWDGSPRVLLYDNLKSAVIERHGSAVRFNPALLALASHYHFEPRPVAIARGNEKGRVERAIRYIRSSFFAAREWTDLADLNAQADAWCEGIAADRPCPEEPRISVREAFEQERPRLLSLPPNPWPSEQRVEVRVPKTPYVRFDLNDYSVPHIHVQQTLSLLASTTQVRILVGDTELARHERCWSRGEQIENAEHVAALVAEKRAATEHRGMNRLHHAAPSASTLLEQAGLRGTSLRTLVRELMRLLDEYGATEVETGCREAIERGVPHSNAVRQCLERRREARGLAPPMTIALPENSPARDIVVRTGSLADYDHINPVPDTDDTEEPDDEPT
ncbi:IS21 family transposase [Granulosicoccus sp. 3-233]|uniref:IS21 family transposase n=1 Tax=Granulosicoccus sp. 3-233 TaxID=3417969 RepID=UPI003D33352F